jgi:uncharacterized protein YegJ (DUF2314 family)
MKWIPPAVIFLGLMSYCTSASAVSKTEFDAALKQADRDKETKDGWKYMIEFSDKVLTTTANQGMRECLSKPDTIEPAVLVFVVSANGTVKRALAQPGIPYGECILSKIQLPFAAPRPPRDNFYVAFALANHHHKETKDKAPKDRPVQTEGNAAIAYDKAIAPYVAKARATWPAAKKRFLAGLPWGWSFAVSYRLLQTDQPTKQERFEDTFVDVKEIKGGMIRGTIGNKLGVVTNYHQGQSIEFPESEIMNWVFIRPDGSEENGNVLGKFLEHYKPQ